MRLTLKEKERLYELMDVLTDRSPHLSIDEFVNEEDNEIYWSIFRKLRLELKGY